MEVSLNTIQPPHRQPLRGLVLGCGDMATEKWYFIHPTLRFELVDAYDICQTAVERARRPADSLGLQVQYHLKDVNDIQLPPETYDLVVAAHSLHHFREIDYIIDQVNQALKPGGLFVVWEDEAIRSDLILPALRRMNILYQYNWAGLLFPLLSGGVAVNFNQDDPQDRQLINDLFHLDRLLCRLGCVEPNFTITIAAKAKGA